MSGEAVRQPVAAVTTETEQVLRLRIRPHEGNVADGTGATQTQTVDEQGRRVTWDEGVVDNEHMNKKKSNKCCIFHKRRAFDESSSEEESEDSDFDDFGARPLKKKGTKGGKSHHHHHHHEDNEGGCSHEH